MNIKIIGGININEQLNSLHENKFQKEKALLIGNNSEELSELKGLALTAGVDIEGKIINKNPEINAAYYIGKGKLSEIEKKINIYDINIIIFDNELTPAQHRNLEKVLNTKVIDRTQLILDIFALHARTKESKLQVELAQLEYMLPRLKGKGNELSRLAGGIGTRGPGESKLETDRRRIEKKIYRLKEKLKDIKRNRNVQRKSRHDPVISLIGYTNAGKSTLMNLLTDAGTVVADKLFATLDAKLRSFTLPDGQNVIISDTVGFIKKLPHQLVASFRASLEEIKEADILIHVIDCHQTEVDNKINVVNSVLKDLDVYDKDIIRVFNKTDLVSKSKLNELNLFYPDTVNISARNGQGKNKLINKITEILKKNLTEIELNLPYEQAHYIDKIYTNGNVLKEEYKNNRITIKACINKNLAKKLKNYAAN